MDIRGHVEGTQRDHQVTLYALSTCVWCKKARQFLEESDLTFDYVYVDLVDRAERRAIRERIRDLSESVSFPAIVVDDRTCVVGYKPDTIKVVLGLP